MKKLCIILGDQLSQSISSLRGFNQENDIILICEVLEEATYVKHHKMKITFLFSAMRHFAFMMEKSGYKVEYIKLDDKNNTGSLKTELERAIKKYKVDSVVLTEPSEYRLLKDFIKCGNGLGVFVDIRPDNRFLCTQQEFKNWAKHRKHLRLEHFYREMRIKHNILMDGDKPIGGKWNFDSENRKPPKEGLRVPEPFKITNDNITLEVIELVQNKFTNHFGNLGKFHFAVTRDQALKVLELFIEKRLRYFGEYQDAMIEGEPWMYHSHISFYLNCGLLLPLECIKAAESAFFKGKAPINAVEGFVRQIIGWREYVRGIYWLKMPDYILLNFFKAKRKLPDFFWNAKTKMNCLNQCVSQTKEFAYAHHIQRLMILGNFALLTGIEPSQVNEWFLVVYADAYEWVVLPNVSGMILYADGGQIVSKPYAAGGNYINKMSDYCKNCCYNVSIKNGTDACPFNYLYWNFLVSNREKLEINPRISMMYKTWERMDIKKQKAIHYDSEKFLNSIDNNDLV